MDTVGKFIKWAIENHKEDCDFQQAQKEYLFFKTRNYSSEMMKV